MEKLEIAIKAAVAAGDLLMEHYGKITQGKQKESLRDMVTEIDELAEKKILSIISNKFKAASFLAEESGFIGKDSENLWIVDALDGTVNYIHGIPFFSVSISYWSSMKPEIGVIYNPLLDTIYYAQKGLGSFVNQKRMKSSESSLKNNLCVMAFSGKAYNPKQRKKEFEIFGQLNDASQGCLRTGSAAINLACLAEGRFSLAIGKANKLWDIAAGIIIAEESGYKVSYRIVDKEKNLVDYLASSPLVERELKDLIDLSYLQI